MKISLLTINIWEGGIIFDPLLHYLKTTNADIVNMQEVYSLKGSTPKPTASAAALAKRFQALEVLQKELDYPHVRFAPEFLRDMKEGKFQRGNATFSKFPIEAAETTFVYRQYEEVVDKAELWSDYPHNLLHSTINIQDKKFHVFNTHGVWGKIGKDTPDRKKYAAAIAEQVRGLDHVILTGDFNMNPDTQAIQSIEKHLRSVFKNELTTTFNMRRKQGAGFANAVADMIFVSPDIHVTEHTCDQVDVTDHLPLRIKFEI